MEAEGHNMITRRIVFALIAGVGSLMALAPLHGAAWSDVDGLDPLPVEGTVLPAGAFAGTLQIVACTLDAAGQLRLTGLLHGTITQRSEARIPVTQQLLSAPATLRDPGQTTDVVVLALAPVALDSVGLRIKLAPIAVDIETLPQVGDELATRLSTP
jgi:hypothetical protein